MSRRERSDPRASVADAAELSAAAERWFRAAFAADNTAEDMAAYCATAFSPEIQRAQLVDPAIDTFLVHDSGGQLIGYAQVRRAPRQVLLSRRPLSCGGSMWMPPITVAAWRTG